MFIPPEYRWHDGSSLVPFLQAYPFAVLVSHGLQATHLPFVTECDERGVIRLTAHLARANGQAETLDNTEVLVVFSGPHAYISPAHYTSPRNVPTWNYAAVHIRGRAAIIRDPAGADAALRKLMLTAEPGFIPQYDTLDPDYKSRLLKGIVAFEILAESVEATEKLSQDKSGEERMAIVAALKCSAHPREQEFGVFMENRYQRILDAQS